MANSHLLQCEMARCVCRLGQIRADVLFEVSHMVARYAAQRDPGCGQVTDGGVQADELPKA